MARPGLDVGARTVAAGTVSVPPDGTCSMSLTWRASLRCQPDRDHDERPDAGDPGPQALGDRTESAQRQSHRGSGGADVLEVGDDVALVLRGDTCVGEHRHLLRAGDHRLERCGAADAVQRGRHRAVGQRTTAPTKL